MRELWPLLLQHIQRSTLLRQSLPLGVDRQGAEDWMGEESLTDKKQYVTRVSVDGRVTLPKPLARAFGLQVNDYVLVEGELSYIKVTPAKIVPKIQGAHEQ